MSSWQTPFSEGVAFYRAGKHNLALGRISEAIKLGADRAKVFELRANILSEELGRHKDALKDAKMAIKLKASEPQGYLRASHIFRKLGSLDSALKMVDHALTLTNASNPKHQIVTDSLINLRAEIETEVEARRRAESTKACHIGHLPFELLSTIFDIASVRYPDENDPTTMKGVFAGKRDPRTCIRLSHVCRHWRQAAIGSPQLWRTLVLSGRKPAKKVALWAERSQGRLEELIISSTDADLQLRGSLADAMMDLGKLFVIPPSILHVTESAKPKLVLDLLTAAFGTALPFQELNLRSNSSLADYKGTIPALRSLSLQGIPISVDMILTENLLFLKLIGCLAMGGPLTAHILHLHNSNVETLIIEPIHNVFVHSVHGHGSEVNLPRLRHLDLKLPWWNPNISTMKTSSLETLRISNVDKACDLLGRIQCNQPTPSKGLPSSASPLRSLRIHASAFIVADLIRALETVGSQLEVLEISRAGMEMTQVVDTLAGNAKGKDRMCPKVTYFNFSYSEKVSGAPIKDLVRSRLGEEGPLIKSLILDGCPLIVPELLPWLRSNIPRVSCVYQTKKEIKRNRR